MQGERRILVASDLSQSSVLAENRAAKLCQRFGVSRFEILNVQDTNIIDMLEQMIGGNAKKSQEMVIERVKKEFEPVRERIINEFGIDTSLKVLFGRPSAEIVRYATEIQPDLIVVGSKPPGINMKFFLGNTPDRLLHVTPAPLLIVRQVPDKYYQNVLIPVDFSENSIYAAKIGVELLVKVSKKSILHAYNIPHESIMGYANVSADLISNFRFDAKQQAENNMAKLMEFLGANNHLEHIIQYGSVLKVIEDFVNKNNPDLIIMGKQGRSNIENMLLGRITRNTINETTCDILVVPLKK